MKTCFFHFGWYRTAATSLAKMAMAANSVAIIVPWSVIFIVWNGIGEMNSFDAIFQFDFCRTPRLERSIWTIRYSSVTQVATPLASVCLCVSSIRSIRGYYDFIMSTNQMRWHFFHIFFSAAEKRKIAIIEFIDRSYRAWKIRNCIRVFAHFIEIHRSLICQMNATDQPVNNLWM